MTVITPTKKGTAWDEMPDPDYGEDCDDSNKQFFENSITCSGFTEDEQQDSSAFVSGLEKILKWINNCTSARTKEIRIQAVLYFVCHKNQIELAREIGVGKAAISQQAVAFKDHFKLERTAGAAAQMRSDEARKTFSTVCKANHQKRKASSGYQASGATSTKRPEKPFSLRQKVSAMATLPS